MKSEAKISICIPTYNQPVFLNRLLDSIAIQSYKNIEVIVSDDTANDGIKTVVGLFADKLNIRFIHHLPALKSPKNWNFALDQATGDFIMLIHQDDWLADKDTIAKYVCVFLSHSNVDFVYSRNTLVLSDNSIQEIKRDYRLIHRLDKSPDLLLFRYVVGPPSNIMVRNTVKTRYDERFIWLVDVDYCVRTIKKGHKTFYLDEHLISIGMHGEQTTVFCNNNPHIVLKENILYANKVEKRIFYNISFYDYYWRLLRNYPVRKKQDILDAGVPLTATNSKLLLMLNFQKNIPSRLLKIGAFSKFFMLLHYLYFRAKDLF